MIFWGVAKISNILGVLEISETVDAGPEPTYAKKMRVPPPTPRGVATTLDATTKKFGRRSGSTECSFGYTSILGIDNKSYLP